MKILRSIWIKRAIAILSLSITGYFLFLHAAMSSDNASEIALIYQIEMLVAGVFWWPASIYIGLRKLIEPSNGALGLELWLIQFLGYFIFFRIKDRFKD